MQDQHHSPWDHVGQWASIVLRFAVGSLFLAASVRKLQGGMETIGKTVDYFRNTFQDTWLPGPLVTVHGYATPFVEALIVIWLISGFRLTAAWVFAGLFATSLAFGMSVAGQFDTAASNYNYVLICCVGLWMSRYDHLRVDQLWSRTKSA